jgi:hypothetical protein
MGHFFQEVALFRVLSAGGSGCPCVIFGGSWEKPVKREWRGGESGLNRVHPRRNPLSPRDLAKFWGDHVPASKLLDSESRSGYRAAAAARDTLSLLFHVATAHFSQSLFCLPMLKHTGIEEAFLEGKLHSCQSRSERTVPLHDGVEFTLQSLDMVTAGRDPQQGPSPHRLSFEDGFRFCGETVGGERDRWQRHSPLPAGTIDPPPLRRLEAPPFNRPPCHG